MHHVAEYLTAQQLGGAHQRVGGFLAGLGRLREHEQLVGRLHLGDERGLNVAAGLICLALEGDDAVRGLQERVHVLARAPALHGPAEVHRAHVRACCLERERRHAPASFEDEPREAALWEQRPRVGGFLERVRHVVGLAHELEERSRFLDPAGGAANVVDDLVGAALPLPRQTRELGAVSARSRQCGLLEPVACRLTDRHDELGVRADQLEQLLAGRPHVADQLRADLVADQRQRAPGLQALGADPQHGAQVLRGAGLAEAVPERLARAGPSPAGEAPCVVDELLAARQQERHVAVLALGRPVEQPDRRSVSDQAAEPLAGPVPVDQEHHPRAEQLEEAFQRGVRVGLVASDGEVVEAALGLVGARTRVLPADPRGGQHPLEEEQPGDVEIRVGDGDLAPDDPHHNDVHVALADVVLQDQRIAAVHRDRRQPRVAEAQPLGARDAFGEGAHERPVAARQAVRHRARHGFAGDLRGQAVELAVGVHHDQVEAVLAPSPAGRQRGDVRAVIYPGPEPTLELAQAPSSRPDASTPATRSGTSIVSTSEKLESTSSATSGIA